MLVKVLSTYRKGERCHGVCEVGVRGLEFRTGRKLIFNACKLERRLKRPKNFRSIERSPQFLCENTFCSVFGLPFCFWNCATFLKFFYRETSRERPKSAPYLRLKIENGGPFGLCETPAGCKKWKKN